MRASNSFLVKHVNIKIYGEVQGVGFRYEAKKEARKLHVFGFIMNEPDGSIYAEIEGEEDALKDFLKWCERGPWPAKVKKIETEWSPAAGKFSGFKIG